MRKTIREMVLEGKSNQEIYQHVQNEYGPDQVAIPHQGYFQRISFGLPYLALGIMLLITYWLGWQWWRRGENKPDPTEELSEEDEQELETLTESFDSPLKD